jgi:hypothetical protein
MKPRTTARARALKWVGAVGAVILLAGGLALGVGGSPRATAHSGSAPGVKTSLSRAQIASEIRSALAHSGVRSHRVMTKSQLTAELMPLFQAQAAADRATAALADTPGMPTCSAPTMPQPTSPPGNSYGVPFLAAITNGELLTGYDEWTANNTTWVAKGETYHLDPWQSSVTDITGWVTGLLVLPQLSATVSPSNIVFCDSGGASCFTASPPAGECIHVSLGGQPSPGEKPVPPITNDPETGKTCAQSPSCVPYEVSLTPSGTSKLSVTGVASNGALELSVTAGAQTTVSLTEGTTVQTCTSPTTDISLASVMPSSLPTTAPVAPTAGNPDYRSLQLPPANLTGPLASSSSVLSGNNFQVPAFAFPPTTSCPNPGLSDTLNAPLGGWDTNGNSIYYENPAAAIASHNGWSQFTITTTVASLKLPIGPPSNFNF